jgi:hypothetical protein
MNWRIVLFLPLLLFQPGEDVPQVPVQQQDATPQQPQLPLPQPRGQSTEVEALQLAAADLVTIPFEDRLYTRYVWCPDGRVVSGRIGSLTVNYLSRAAIINRPDPVTLSNILLLRVDLRKLVATDDQLHELIDAWEQLQFDPRFSVLLTKATLQFATGFKVPTRSIEEIVDVPGGYIHTDGQRYTQKRVKKEVSALFTNQDVLRQVNPSFDPKLIEFLVESTHSQASVVSLSYLAGRGLKQVQGKNSLYTTIYGGLYYRFRGLKKGFKKGTDEDNYFAAIGIGDIEKNVRARDVFNKQGSDARIVKAISDITGHVRRMDFIRSLSGHVNFNTSLVVITQDLSRDSIDIDQNPLFNLDPFSVVKFDAKEAIREIPNGLNEFTLFNGNGDLLDQATDDIAADTTIPSPFGTVLEPAIGCIRCHASDSGWRKVSNDVSKLTGFLDIFDDRSRGKYSRQETIQRLVGLYAGSPEQIALPRARDDYNRAILRATGPWEESKTQADLALRSGNELASVLKDYFYRYLTAIDALRDLGIVWQGDDPVKAGIKLQETLGLDLNAVNANTQYIYPIQPNVIGPPIAVPEDPEIALLMKGSSLTRSSYDLRYGFMLARKAAKTSK